MESIKAENPQAYDWLAQIPAHHWSRSHFQLDNKCDILLNNMCEAFNRSIVFARQQGILVMLEMIREYLMRRIQSKREECELWRYLKITPNANKLLNKFRIWSGGCYSAYAGYNQYEINTVSGHKFSVDLNTRTCGCRRWGLTGIPCHHAICAMNRNGVDPVDYVDVVYSVKTYRACYSGIVYPMNGEAQWTKTGHVVTPPFVQKQPGRPKLKRKHDGNDLQEREEVHGVGATLARNSQMTVRCSVCNQAGHNRRTCKKVMWKLYLMLLGLRSLWQLKLSGQLGQPGMTIGEPSSRCGRSNGGRQGCQGHSLAGLCCGPHYLSNENFL
ncbi:hypothetical protein DCAR_0520399 [Daucus carota subsp. sativus]|uniref:Zinc finger PMZ-type domain-containing protein n=1 Tax=Daucus carota subsp. sativus TaxID=79200 RepID=A0AAF0X747_DAUCS|nr:hypothetical protein DCAR_0520399 [Daucus carota subsp. sativus]